MSILLNEQPFSRYKVVENRKKWDTLNDLEHLTVKSTLHTLSTYHRGPNVGPFHSVTSYFSRYGVVENGQNRKCTEWPHTDFEILTVKRTSYTQSNYPWGPNFGPFCSMISRFQISHILQFPIDYQVKRPKNKKKTIFKSQIWNVAFLYINISRDPS